MLEQSRVIGVLESCPSKLGSHLLRKSSIRGLFGGMNTINVASGRIPHPQPDRNPFHVPNQVDGLLRHMDDLSNLVTHQIGNDNN